MAKETPVKKWMFSSQSNPDRSYTVSLWRDGRITCNCPKWCFKSAGADRECLHTNGVKLQLNGNVPANEPAAAIAAATGPKRMIRFDEAS